MPIIFGRIYAGPTVSGIIMLLPHADVIAKSVFCALSLCFAFIAIRTSKAQPGLPSAAEGLEPGLVYTQLAMIAVCFVVYLSIYFLKP